MMISILPESVLFPLVPPLFPLRGEQKTSVFDTLNRVKMICSRCSYYFPITLLRKEKR